MRHYLDQKYFTASDFMKYLLLVLASLLFFSCAPDLQANEKKESVTLLAVVDGDTLRVRRSGNTERIRLLGIDAPETKPNPKATFDAKREHRSMQELNARGKDSYIFLKNLIREGSPLSIELDTQQRDKYGRLLAYVYLPSGEMINKIMLKEGYARPMIKEPNSKYSKSFYQEFDKAKENKKGLWK